MIEMRCNGMEENCVMQNMTNFNFYNEQVDITGRYSDLDLESISLESR